MTIEEEGVALLCLALKNQKQNALPTYNTYSKSVVIRIFTTDHPKNLKSLHAKISSIDLEGKVAGFNSTFSGRF
jgi:hypothetical protein